MLSLSISALIRWGKPVTVWRNTACSLSRLKSFLYPTGWHRYIFKEWQQTVNSSMVYQLRRTKGLSAQGWKYPPDVVNRGIINPVLCLGATEWLHASVTLSNPRVSIRRKKEKTLKCLSGHGVRCSPWNIHNLRAAPQWRRWQHARIWLAETETLETTLTDLAPVSRCHSQNILSRQFSGINGIRHLLQSNLWNREQVKPYFYFWKHPNVRVRPQAKWVRKTKMFLRIN